jgi:hypothetical protein
MDQEYLLLLGDENPQDLGRHYDKLLEHSW